MWEVWRRGQESGLYCYTFKSVYACHEWPQWSKLCMMFIFTVWCIFTPYLISSGFHIIRSAVSKYCTYPSLFTVIWFMHSYCKEFTLITTHHHYNGNWCWHFLHFVINILPELRVSGCSWNYLCCEMHTLRQRESMLYCSYNIGLPTFPVTGKSYIFSIYSVYIRQSSVIVLLTACCLLVTRPLGVGSLSLLP